MDPKWPLYTAKCCFANPDYRDNEHARVFSCSRFIVMGEDEFSVCILIYFGRIRQRILVW